jgi:hypothetical protein
MRVHVSVRCLSSSLSSCLSSSLSCLSSSLSLCLSSSLSSYLIELCFDLMTTWQSLGLHRSGEQALLRLREQSRPQPDSRHPSPGIQRAHTPAWTVSSICHHTCVLIVGICHDTALWPCQPNH